MPERLIERAILEEYGTRQMDPEMEELESGLAHLGVPVEFLPAKSIYRRKAALTRSTLVAGSIPYVQSALRQLGVYPPVLDDYPPCLAHLLHRRIWSSTVDDLIRGFQDERSQPVFAKPSNRRKRFTGRIFGRVQDLEALEGVSRRTALHCSEIVSWRVEHRVFVLRGRILGIRPYAGDESLEVDLDVAREAIDILERSGWPLCGFALDLGLLADGTTALVEVNDAWGLGSWGLDPDAYTELITERWREMVRAPLRGASR